MEVVLVVEEQEEQVVKLRKGRRRGIVGGVGRVKRRDFERTCTLLLLLKLLLLLPPTRGQNFRKSSQQINFVFGERQRENKRNKLSPSPVKQQSKSYRNLPQTEERVGSEHRPPGRRCVLAALLSPARLDRLRLIKLLAGCCYYRWTLDFDVVVVVVL